LFLALERVACPDVIFVRLNIEVAVFFVDLAVYLAEILAEC